MSHFPTDVAWSRMHEKLSVLGFETSEPELSINREREMDEDKLHQFVGQMLNDLGGAVSIALVRMGDALGLYKTLHRNGPMTTKELAAAAGVNERYLREWASHHAA